MSDKVEVRFHEDEFTLTATIRPDGIQNRIWPFPHLPKPNTRLPCHLTAWQRILTRSSVKDRTQCYRFINELRQGVRAMEAYRVTLEEKEKNRDEAWRRERVCQQKVMRRRREARGPITKLSKVKPSPQKPDFESSDDDFATPITPFKPCLNSLPCEASLLTNRCNCK